MCTEIYGKEYQTEYEKRSQTELGKKIYAERWDFVTRNVPPRPGSNPIILLDYGCANGAFHLSMPSGYATSGFDVNPTSPFSLPITLSDSFEVLTFWDSLEHIPNFIKVIETFHPKWLFISTPNLESVQGPVKEWKHYKPHEHIFYFDRHSIKTIFESIGYDIVEINYGEGALRNPNDPQAIISLALKKRS